MKGWFSRAAACASVVGLLLMGGPSAMTACAETAPEVSTTIEVSADSFEAYYERCKDSLPAQTALILTTPSLLGDGTTSAIEDNDAVITLPEGTFAEWTVSAPAGVYRMTLTYRVDACTEITAACGVALNGFAPFSEAAEIALNKVWTDEERKQDNRGNDISPTQIAVPAWNTAILNAQDNITVDSYYFCFDGTETTVRLSAVRGTLSVKSIRLDSAECLPTYEQYLHQYSSSPDNTQNNVQVYEAENALYKSSSSLYPVGERSSAAVTPNDPVKNRLNCIGGGNWKNNGQWISWEITVPADGWYTLDFKYRQNGLRGLEVRRRLTIDDQIPFQEADGIRFAYGNGWQFLQPGGDEPYRFYLTAGKHVLRLESVLGDLTTTLSSLNGSLVELNTLYRRIIMITGVSPDLYNDYFLHKEIPELLDTLQRVSDSLEADANTLEKATGGSGSSASSLYDIVRQLRSFYKKPNSIPSRLDSFRSNLSVLAELVLSLKEQPLELDSFSLCSADTASPRKTAGFFETVKFRVIAFIASFSSDYASIGNSYEGDGKLLEVWISVNELQSTGVSSGRDQATVLKQFIDEQFTPEYGIHIKLNLVNTSDTLLQAIVGGKAPDVALFVPESQPLTLAMRGGLMDLSQLPQFEAWQQRVYPSAFIPYQYNGGVYAMPETQVFNVLYYRTDIFDEMGLTPPDTWEEFYRVTAILQGKNLQVGVSSDQSTFEMLLLQRGASIYNEDVSRIALTEPDAIAAFREWTELYTQYGIPLSYDFFNRFRTGEMPMAIASLTMYSQLSIAAPEINGVWSMAPIPATVDGDTVSRAQGCTTTGCVILKDCADPESAAVFIDWWTSDDVQARFGNSIENRMGASARYNTANKNAFEQIPWEKEQRAMLQSLWESVSEIPQSPASYSVSRNVLNAFRRVVYYNETAREVLNKYAQDMDRELIRKRQEFGLE